LPNDIGRGWTRFLREELKWYRFLSGLQAVWPKNIVNPRLTAERTPFISAGMTLIAARAMPQPSPLI
jgi:hypothetical protein